MNVTAIARLVARLATWTVIGLAAFALAVGVFIPRLAGATPYAVLTGSMRPALPPGTLAIVRPVPTEQIRTGSVLTYQLESGRPAVVTHRVIAQGVSTTTGEPVFRTRGDANPGPDPGWVRAVQVRGTVWYAVPLLGYPASVLTGDQRELIIAGAAGALLLYAAVMFTGAVRDRRAASVATTPRRAAGAER